MQTSFNINGLTGLSESAAARKLAQNGYNELPSTRPASAWRLLGEIVTEPMFLLLVTCGVLYLVLGEPQDATMLLGFVLVCIEIGRAHV